MDLLAHLRFTGPALPEPFVRFELERELAQRKLLPKSTGAEGARVQQGWESYRRTLRELVAQGGAVRVRNHVLEPLVTRLGYASLEPAPDVATREGLETGGHLFVDGDGRQLRAWSTALAEDLDAPARRGHAYRYSHARIAQRVLLASGEQAGLLTNGLELRLLLSNPAGRDSEISIPIDPVWKRSRDAPDSYRLLLALASPAGVQAVPDLVEKARLQQTRVTKELRVQARQAVEQFVQELLDHPTNQALLAAHPNRAALAAQLWREGLIFVYRLLFILKLEASDDPAQAFGFASTSLWRHTFSPSMALAGYARAVLDEGAETGRLLEEGVRGLFRMFTEGVQASELHVKPLGGVLFGPQATPLLSQLRWSERGVAHLLDRLLWTPRRRGADSRQRVHYGPLDVKDLGRVYEALLELEPGAAAEPMCRLRRQKLEVVVPEGQGVKYQVSSVRDQVSSVDDLDGEEVDVEDEAGEDAPTPDTRHVTPDTRVQWIEAIPTGRFYLRAGLGRKSSGSFYTPDPFVTFLVQETLGPLVERVSPRDDPQPLAILSLKVIDDACGSGHFIVESDRFMGDKLYEACRLCDERALEAERQAEKARSAAERQRLLAEAAAWRQRVADLPDPNDELVLYLPSRAPEGEESGLSQRKALALCKRLVAVHCLYGVDKNPLAVELARLALWIETQSEGLPLTFLDHRIVVGDSLTGPFFHHLLTLPGSQQPLEGLYSQGLSQRFNDALRDALGCVADLEASIGSNQAETEAKQAAKARLDRALAPFRVVAAAWAGGVMLGPAQCDDEGYLWLAGCVAESGDLPDDLAGRAALQAMIARGLGVDAIPAGRDALLALLASGQCVPALPFELAFPEVFYPTGDLADRRGFHVTLGNPPWEGLDTSNKEFFAGFDISILDLRTDKEISVLVRQMMEDPAIRFQRERYEGEILAIKSASRTLFPNVSQGTERASGATPDLYQCFAERNAQLLCDGGIVGLVLPSSFHANESATGVRRLYLRQMELIHCYSFENRRKLFEIHSSYKFAVVIAKSGASTISFHCAFYLHDDEWLFTDRKIPEPLTYSLDFVESTTGGQLNFLELRRASDVEPTEIAYGSATIRFGELRRKLDITPTEELHRTKERSRFVATSAILDATVDPRSGPANSQTLAAGFLPLVEGKTMHQFTDLWENRPEFLVPIKKMSGKEARLEASRTSRLALRMVASSTNERTSIFTVLPPGVVCSNSVSVESQPFLRRTYDVLALCALANAYVFDWLLRQTVAANIRFSYLDNVPVPVLDPAWTLLAHAATRLVSNHDGYAPLWREQLGDTWREATPPFTWPVLAGNDARWAVRAAIDAVVAQAYGLDRAQYAHVLSTFSHKSYPQAPALCLARFDELTAIGLEAFTKRWDPYWDVPLNESLPAPVIELPVVVAGSDEQQLRLEL